MSRDPSPDVNLNPGPVPLADATQRALAGPMVSHRSPEFEALYRDCRSMLQSVFRTENDLLVVNGNGNVGLETAIANCVRPDDPVVCLANGKFGDNLVEMVSRYTDELRVVEADWGQPVGLDAVREAITAETAAVVTTHCETSTGMLNPVREVARLADDRGALSIVDGVSSIGGQPLPVDDWGVDLAITASQKCLSAPPGLSAVSTSDDALDRWESNPRTMPYNLDLGRYRRAAARDQTPSTAPVHTYRALRQAVADILEVGLDGFIEAQAARAEAIRRAAEAMGLEVFPTPDADAAVSDTVTVLELPDDLPASWLVARLEAQAVRVSTGIGPLADRVVRVATMSNATTDDDVRRAVEALGSALESRTDASADAGVRAAEAVLGRAPGS